MIIPPPDLDSIMLLDLGCFSFVDSVTSSVVVVSSSMAAEGVTKVEEIASGVRLSDSEGDAGNRSKTNELRRSLEAV